MKGDMPAASLRLMSDLPVRTHHSPQPASGSKAFGNNRGDGKPKPVKIDGVIFESGSAARRRLKLSWTELAEMIESGEAQHV